MKNATLRAVGVMLLGGLLLGAAPAAQAQTGNLVTYAGNAGQEKFLDLVRLSDGTLLVAGAAQDLNWVPADVPQTVLGGSGGIHNAGRTTARVAFLMQLAADASRILRVVSLPAGAAESISRVRSTEVPGQATGTLFISGTTLDSRAQGGGYFLARLDNNFVDGTPTALAWTANVWAEGYVFDRQPWDVGADGRLVYITGQSHANDWCAAYALDGATGQRVAVPEWRTHWLKSGAEYWGPAASAPGGAAAVSYSGIVFKKTGRCDLRSWTSADYSAALPDGNGRTKKGRWPLDVFFSGPCDPAAPSTAGPGYTGYSTSAKATYGVGAVAIDRRSNDLYVGFNVQSKLPGGNPDFEPAVLALSADGGLKWWSRLYHETDAKGQPVNSTPDQYVDGLAIDYSGSSAEASSLVVLARCHGNNVENYWPGNKIAATPGAKGYQNQFTGTKGNIHISWLGKLAGADGTLRRSTFLAEYEDAMGGTSGTAADPNLDGWPDPNAGWPNLNDTRARDLQVAADGAVAVVAVGRRATTTRTAFQKMLRAGTGPGTGVGTWASFVRVYAPDLGSLRYSSVLTGAWDLSTGAGGDNTVLEAVLPEAGRVLAAGWQKEGVTAGTAAGNPVPTAAVPAWGGASPQGQSALLASLSTGPSTTTTTTATATTGAASAGFRLLLAPNPARGSVQVRVEGPGASPRIAVLDALGRAVLARPLPAAGTLTLPLAGLAPGVYLVRAETAAGPLVQRLLVE